METADFAERLSRDGGLLLDLALRAGWEARVPSCPEWRVRELVAHTGSVHRWAAQYVAGRTDPAPIPNAAPADDDSLASWFREGHRTLTDGIASAPGGLECWSFLPAPTPLAFWARRQAHETAIHRVDAELAAGVEHRPFDAAFACDGVDELLTGFHVRSRSRVRTDRPRSLLIAVTDGDTSTGTGTGSTAGADAKTRAWLLRLSPEPPRAERLPSPDGALADCTVRAPADVLYRSLWNRGRHEDLTVTGDASLLALWRDTSAVVAR